MKSFLQEKYHLKTNPFGERVDPQAPMAGRKREERLWTDIINRRKGERGNSLNFIVGDYGTGKTLTLYTIKKQTEEDTKILPLYLKFLPEDPIQKFGLDFIQRIFKNELPLQRIKGKCPKDFDKIFPETGLVLKKFLANDALAQIYIKGERSLTAKELRELGAKKRVASTDVAKDYLLAFLYLLKSAGIETLLLLIDEVEYVFSQMRGAKIALVFNALRDLYDLPQSPRHTYQSQLSNIIFFFAISQSGWNKLTDLEKRERTQGGPIQPLLSRLEKEILLKPLDNKETNDLITLRLSLNRVQVRYEDDPLIPFTEGFVKYVFKLTRGLPREIVERCDYVLGDGLRDSVSLLTENYAKKVFESHGLSTQSSS